MHESFLRNKAVEGSEIREYPCEGSEKKGLRRTSVLVKSLRRASVLVKGLRRESVFMKGLRRRSVFVKSLRRTSVLVKGLRRATVIVNERASILGRITLSESKLCLCRSRPWKNLIIYEFTNKFNTNVSCIQIGIHNIDIILYVWY